VVASDAETRAHVDAVSGRLELAAPDDLRELTLLVAAVHEERDPERLRKAAVKEGAAHRTDAVVVVALAFGEIWNVTDEPSLDAFVGRHAGHLRALLLFELAHEGAATEPMRAAAARAGIAHELAGWQAALSGA
jgi:hypothetical protein